MATRGRKTTEQTQEQPVDVGVELLHRAIATAFQELVELIVEAGRRAPDSDEVRAKQLLESLPLFNEPLTRAEFVRRALSGQLRRVAEAIRDWPELEAVTIIEALQERWQRMDDHDLFDLDLDDVIRWLTAHRHADKADDRAQAVVDCIELRPPANVRVLRRLPHAGSQKVVYEATWRSGERTVPVALKQLRATARDALTRELLTHPLSLSHPNIVQTYSLQNAESPPEDFLVEAWLKHPLDDAWRASGLHEAAQLLVDLARALTFLHDLTLIHGDVKPDNIGIESGRFILLDFGIARPRTKFTAEVTPTGSLRTRAPELLTGGGIHAEKTDVWALGATVFNTVVGRFPLFRSEGDEVPKAIGSRGEQARAEFAAELKRRVEKEWDAFLAPVLNPKDADPTEARLLCEDERFRRLLAKMLGRDHHARPTALEVLHEALESLPALVGESGGRVFAPAEELDQLDRYLGSECDLRLLPGHKRRQLTDRLDELDESLKAQRYRQALAAEIIDTYGPLPAPETLGEEDRAVVKHLLDDLGNFRGTVSDMEEDHLLDELRARLDVGTRDEREDNRSFLDALDERLGQAIARVGLTGYDGGSFVRRLSEFRQALRESA
jgi:serine/threonine protein kinase